MRKILLGTTAVIGAALLAPMSAMAQDGGGGRTSAVVNPAMPDGANYGRTGGPALVPGDVTVRVGGYFAGWYSHTTQSNPNTFGQSTPGAAGAVTGAGVPGVGNVYATGTTALQIANGATATGVTPVNTGGQSTANQVGSAKTGKNDFHSDAEIHIYVDGKAANGLRYGAVLEMTFNGSEGTMPGAGRRTFTFKTGGLIDEMYAYAALPGLGQVRFGDEDGSVGLMTTGVLTGFGTGGVYGSWQNSVVRPNRTTTSPGDLGDNTKIIYLSPQLFGFDFGVSYALNSNTGAGNGCVASYAVYSCDRTYAYTGATGNNIQSWSDLPQRRNEVQAVLRYRGQFGPVGIATSIGHVGWTAIRDMSVAGNTVKTLRPGNVWMAGLQASAYGFSLGAMYQWGQSNLFWGSQARGDQSMWQYTAGGTYTTGPLTIGGNAFWGNYSGSNGFTFNGGQTAANLPNAAGVTSGSCASGAYCSNLNSTGNAMRRWGIAAGANYRLAPGMDLVAEYVRHGVHEAGNTNLGGVGATSNVRQDKLRADVILIGTRLAF